MSRPWFEKAAARAMMDVVTESLDEPVAIDRAEGVYKRRIDMVPANQPTPEEEVIERVGRQELRRKILSVLSRREAYCLVEYYLKERRLKDIGDDLRICRERVRQILLTARRKLAEAFGVEFSCLRNHYHTGRRNLA